MSAGGYSEAEVRTIVERVVRRTLGAAGTNSADIPVPALIKTPQANSIWGSGYMVTDGDHAVL